MKKSELLMKAIAESKKYILEDHLTPGVVVSYKKGDSIIKVKVISNNGDAYEVVQVDSEGNEVGDSFLVSDEDIHAEIEEEEEERRKS